MHKIQAETQLSDTMMTNVMAKGIREEVGKNAIAPGYNAVIKEQTDLADKYMNVEEVTMKVKNPDGNDYVDDKRNLVYCNNIDKVSPSLKVLNLKFNFNVSFTLWQITLKYELQYFKTWTDLLVRRRNKSRSQNSERRKASASDWIGQRG